MRHDAVEMGSKAAAKVVAVGAFEKSHFLGGHGFHNDQDHICVFGKFRNKGCQRVGGASVVGYFLRGIDVNEFQWLVFVFGKFQSAFDKSEGWVESYLVEKGVVAEIGGSYTNGGFFVEATAHAGETSENEKHSDNGGAIPWRWPVFGNEPAPFAEAQQKPIAYGNDNKYKEIDDVGGFADNHVDDHGGGVAVVERHGVEACEEIAEIGYVGGASEKAKGIAYPNKIMKYIIISLAADMEKFANQKTEDGNGEDVATDNGVEAPTHKQRLWVESLKVGCAFGASEKNEGSDNAEKRKVKYAEKVGGENVSEFS